MRLSYVYLKSFGCLRNQEINFDSRYRFRFDGERLHVFDAPNLPRAFFSLNGEEHGLVDAASAIVGENGAGKTSIARFLAGLFNGRDIARNYIAIIFLHGRYYAFYNFPSSKKNLVELASANVPGMRCFEYPSDSEVSNAEVRRIFESVELVYHTPHFTDRPVFQSDRVRVCDYSTAGLIADVGRSSGGWGNVGRYAMQEQLRALHVIRAYLSAEDAPTEPGEILRRTGVKISWRRGTLSIAQRYGLVGEQRNRNVPKEISDLSRDLVKAGIVRAGRGCALFKTFAYFIIALLRECVLRSREREIDWDNHAYVDLFALCRQFVHMGEDYEGARDLIFRWVDEYGSEKCKRRLKCYWAGSRIEHFGGLLRGVERLGSMYGLDKLGNSLNVEMSQDEGVLNLVLSIADDYLKCMGDIEFMEFELSPRLSSGEMAFISMWGRLFDFVERHRAADLESDDGSRAHDAILFLDESETSLHPEWQRKLVWYTIWFFERFARELKVHIIFASHSPILLSDIPGANVCYLPAVGLRSTKRFRTLLEKKQNTFAANIFDLYRSSFFLENGPLGELAKNKIEALSQRLKKATEEIDSDDALLLDLIGDDFLRGALKMLIKEGK